jgi:hypothetical protein
MKTKPTGKALTFGSLVMNFYNAYGKRKANGILRLAAKLGFVGFRGRNRYVLSSKAAKNEK